MPVSTTTNTSLSLTLDGTEVNCQIQDLSFSPPMTGAVGEIIEVACGDSVTTPGALENGTLTGTVFADPVVGGITDILLQAQETDAEIAFVLTFWDDQATTQQLIFTGTAKVNSLQLDFARPGYAQHPIDLVVLTSVMSRPV